LVFWRVVSYLAATGLSIPTSGADVLTAMLWPMAVMIVKHVRVFVDLFAPCSGLEPDLAVTGRQSVAFAMEGSARVPARLFGLAQERSRPPIDKS